MGTYKDLSVWQKGTELVKKIDLNTKSFPADEQFGLTGQMRRCSVSTPSNIAEGFGRNSDKELIRFLYISLGSSAELDTQLIIAKELCYMDESNYVILSALNEEIGKMISSLIYRRSNNLDSFVRS